MDLDPQALAQMATHVRQLDGARCGASCCERKRGRCQRYLTAGKPTPCPSGMYRCEACMRDDDRQAKKRTTPIYRYTANQVGWGG